MKSDREMLIGKPVQPQKASVAMRAQAARAAIEDVLARATPPAECGPEIPVAPGRGAFAVVEPVTMVPDGADGYRAAPGGFAGRMALRSADALDLLAVAAARATRPPPLTPAQVGMARRYADLTERHAAGTIRLSQLDRAGGGPGEAAAEAAARLAAELARLHRRIGSAVAMSLRRIRPSMRGERAPILARTLVDRLILDGVTPSRLLREHGWAVKGETVQAVLAALAQVLDRMAGEKGACALSQSV